MTDEPTSRPLSVLVVDDEPFMRKMVARVLESEGHTVRIAGDGLEALGIFREFGCDLLITDFHMPNMNGDVLAGLVKEVAPGTPVVMITGHQTRISGEAVDCRLQKPFTPDDLLATVRRVTTRQ